MIHEPKSLVLKHLVFSKPLFVCVCVCVCFGAKWPLALCLCVCVCVAEIKIRGKRRLFVARAREDTHMHACTHTCGSQQPVQEPTNEG